MIDFIKRRIMDMYFAARGPVIQAAVALFPARFPTGEEPFKILLIRIDRMGDLILSIPVIDNLRLAYPKAKINILVRPELWELARMIKGISEVIACDDSVRALKEIRREEYDIAIDMHYDYKLETAMIALLSGAPVRAGFAWGSRERLFTHYVAPGRFPGTSMTGLLLEILKALDVPVVVNVPKIEIADAPAPNPKLIAIHPGGYYPSQRWPAANFGSLAGRLSDELGSEIIALGGHGDRRIIKELISYMGDRKLKVAFPGMRDMALILKESRLLICNNSGPLHFAQALGVPTVSTMGPTDPVLWWPVGQNSIVVRKGPDVNRITVDDMFEAVKMALGL